MLFVDIGLSERGSTIECGERYSSRNDGCILISFFPILPLSVSFRLMSAHAISCHLMLSKIIHLDAVRSSSVSFNHNWAHSILIDLICFHFISFHLVSALFISLQLVSTHSFYFVAFISFISFHLILTFFKFNSDHVISFYLNSFR